MVWLPVMRSLEGEWTTAEWRGQVVCMAFNAALLAAGRRPAEPGGRPRRSPASGGASVVICSASVWGRMARCLAIGAFPLSAPGRAPWLHRRPLAQGIGRSFRVPRITLLAALAAQRAGPLGWQAGVWQVACAACRAAGCRSVGRRLGQPTAATAMGCVEVGRTGPGLADGPGDLSGLA